MKFASTGDQKRVAKPILLEVIAESAADAVAAERGGADRIELVAHLHLGGTTPMEEMIRETARAVDIPVYVMIRPRDGDAVYTKSELAQMADAVAMAEEAGADGLVLGVSRPDGFVDGEAVAALLENAALPASFHRAFDAVPRHQMVAALDVLAWLPRVERVLTSAGLPDADVGRFELRRLVERERPSERVPDRPRPTIMPGGGVTAANLARIVTDTGAGEIHVGRAARVMPVRAGSVGGKGWVGRIRSERGTGPAGSPTTSPERLPVLEAAVRHLKQILNDVSGAGRG